MEYGHTNCTRCFLHICDSMGCLECLEKDYSPEQIAGISKKEEIEQIHDVEDKLNNRPRKRFGYETPKYVYL